MKPEFPDWKALRSPYPHNLTIDIHSYCNAKCVICPYPQLKDRLPMGWMDEGLFKRIIDEFAEVNRNHDINGEVIFCNMGELFIDPEVFWKLAYVQDAGLRMVVQTNAALLTPEKTDRLIECGFKGPIYVSFHGITREVYESIMGLPYEKTLNNILYLVEKYDRGPIQVRSFSYNWPLGEARKVKEFWAARGVNVKLAIPNARTGLLANVRRTSLKYPGPWLRGCKKTLPFRDMVVAFNGQAVLCCEDMARRGVIGDLSQGSLLEVWNGPQAEKIMNFMHGGGWGRTDDFLCRTCEFGLSTQFRRLVKNLDNQWQKLVKTRI